jgi:hypothetical protein
MANFENLLGRLIEHQVEFVLVGGFAATATATILVLLFMPFLGIGRQATQRRVWPRLGTYPA